jgi:hypothetical protein
MTKAFLDTTILADVLLKIGPENVRARNSLRMYDELLVSGYAVKEFKRGALRYYIWLHNKIITTGSWGDAVAAIATVHRQRNLSMTASKAAGDFLNSMAEQRAQAGDIARTDAEYREMQAKEARSWLKTKIIKAWRDQGRKPFIHVEPLSCYAVVPPNETPLGLINNSPIVCTLSNCCLTKQFSENLDATERLERACEEHASKPEMAKRRTVLKDIRRKPKARLEERDCIALGDAVFALQCPPGAVVLTTNLSDHGPLTAALGKSADTPAKS